MYTFDVCQLYYVRLLLRVYRALPTSIVAIKPLTLDCGDFQLGFLFSRFLWYGSSTRWPATVVSSRRLIGERWGRRNMGPAHSDAWWKERNSANNIGGDGADDDFFFPLSRTRIHGHAYACVRHVCTISTGDARPIKAAPIQVIRLFSLLSVAETPTYGISTSVDGPHSRSLM